MRLVRVGRFLGLVFVLSVGFHVQPKALTLSELQTAIRLNVRDTGSSGNQRYSDTTLTTLINEAQRDVVNETWCLQNTTYYALTAGTTYYDLPTNFLAISQVNFRESSGKTRGLEEKSEKALAQENPDWARQAGAPINYFTQYSTSNATALMVTYYPIPTSSTLGTVIIDYYAQPTDLSASTDVPFNGFRHLYPYHSAITDHVSSRIKMLEGDVTAATGYLQTYAIRIKTMIERFQQMPNYFPSVSAGGSR